MTTTADSAGIHPQSVHNHQRDHQRALAGGVSRTLALAGLAGVVFYAVGVLLPGSAPNPDATTRQIAAFFIDERGSLLLGFALQSIALALFLCFLGQLRARVAGAGGIGVPLASAMAGAWVILLTMIAVGMLPALALTWRGAPLADSSVVHMAYGVQVLATYAASATVAMVSIGAPSLVIWRSGVLPKWLALLGGAEIAVNVLELFGLSVRHGTAAGGYFAAIGPLLWVAWVAATSICMARIPAVYRSGLVG